MTFEKHTLWRVPLQQDEHPAVHLVRTEPGAAQPEAAYHRGPQWDKGSPLASHGHMQTPTKHTGGRTNGHTDGNEMGR